MNFCNAIILGVLAVSTWACQKPDMSESADQEMTVAGWINATPVSAQDFEKRLRIYIMDTGISESQVQANYPDIAYSCLEEMAKEIILLNQNLVALDDSVTSDLTKEMNFQDSEFPTGFEMLKNDIQDWEERIHKKLILIRIASLISEALSRDIVITDDAVFKEYELKIEAYMEPMMLQVRTICVSDLALAEDIHKKLKRGWGFVKLAQNYSTLRDEGERGSIIQKTIDEFSVEFIEELSKVPEKNVTKVMTDGRGYYLFRVEKRTPSRPIPFDDVKEGIRQELFSKESSRRFKEWLESELMKMTLKVEDPVMLSGGLR